MVEMEFNRCIGPVRNVEVLSGEKSVVQVSGDRLIQVVCRFDNGEEEVILDSANPVMSFLNESFEPDGAL